MRVGAVEQAFAAAVGVALERPDDPRRVRIDAEAGLAELDLVLGVGAGQRTWPSRARTFA